MTSWIFDTNVLLRIFARDDPDHVLARGAANAIPRRKENLATTVQCLREFWVVSTRPQSARGGLGLSVKQATRRLQWLLGKFAVVVEDSRAVETWHEFVQRYEVKGVQAHDAYLAAIAKISDANLLTFNAKDFARFGDEIDVFEPVFFATVGS